MHLINCRNLILAGATLLFAGQASAALVHRWSFNDGSDSVGGATATTIGGANFSGGQLELPGGAARTNYASAPGITATLASNPSISVEAWFTMDTLQNWSKVWMFGTAGGQPALSYIDFTPYSGLASHVPKIDFDPTGSGELNTVGGTDPAVMGSATEYYVCTIYDAGSNLMSFYVNGVLADSAPMGGGNITQLGNTAQNFFGAAVNYGDPDVDGRINEMRIWNNVLTQSDITLHNAVGPNTIPEPTVTFTGLLAGAGMLLRRRRKA